jgi:hypothetical protein
MTSTELTKIEQNQLRGLELLASKDQPCPEGTVIKSLAEKGHIRIERYVSTAKEQTVSCRIVWILTGPHTGRHTAKPRWLKLKNSPVDIVDARSTKMLRGLGLIAPSDIVAKRDKNRPISLALPDWAQ